MYTVSFQNTLLLAHYFEAKVGKGHLLKYSICGVHTPLPSVSHNFQYACRGVDDLKTGGLSLQDCYSVHHVLSFTFTSESVTDWSDTIVVTTICCKPFLYCKLVGQRMSSEASRSSLGTRQLGQQLLHVVQVRSRSSL